MCNRRALFLLVCFFIKITSYAAPMDTAIANPFHIEHFYVGSSFDAGIFSTANIQQTFPATPTSNAYTSTSSGTLRFTYVINYGFSFNFNLTRHFGIFTGVDIKNVGFIQKEDGETIKRRTYNLGVPLGIKVGKLKHKGTYMFLGGGLDAPINYKEKEFEVRSDKSKFNEWFSDRTPRLMPYVFVGVKVKNGLTFKFQYYPNNFLNPNYTASNGTQPYAGYDVHLILFTIGYDFHFGKHKDMVKTSVTHLNTNTL